MSWTCDMRSRFSIFALDQIPSSPAQTINCAQCSRTEMEIRRRVDNAARRSGSLRHACGVTDMERKLARGDVMKIVVIGGTGLIGSKVVAKLKQKGHEELAAALTTGVNTITGKGLKEAMAGTQVVVDVANSPSFEEK